MASTCWASMDASYAGGGLYGQLGRCAGIALPGAVMSLSARERHVLDTIKSELTDSDPKLAGLLAIFTRLVSGEDMPLRETIRSGPPHANRRRASHRRGPARVSAGQRVNLRQGALLLWLLATAVVAGLALILSHGGASSCAQPWPAVCAEPGHAHRSHPATPGQPVRAGGTGRAGADPAIGRSGDDSDVYVKVR